MAKYLAGSVRVKSDFQSYFNVIWLVQFKQNSGASRRENVNVYHDAV
jgi:hypothetical protein